MPSVTACDSLWMSDTASKRRPFCFIFNLCNKAKSHGAKSGRVGRMGKDNHVVVSHKLSGFHGRVGVVVMKEPLVVASNFRSFSSHIFSQASQNITIKFRVDCNIRGIKSR
jgi:hypothetical protein